MIYITLQLENIKTRKLFLRHIEILTYITIIHHRHYQYNGLAIVNMKLFTCNFITCGTAAGTDHVTLMQSTALQ